MNTGEVTKRLGVSRSTIKRWIKQCNLQLDKNELGHYLYSETDVQILMEHKENMASATLEDGKIEPRKGKVVLPKEQRDVTKRLVENINNHKIIAPPSQESGITDKQLMEKLSMIERSLANKADSVVTYQLLQHRKEIEELENQIKLLTERIAKLEMKKEPSFPAEARPLIEEPNRKKTTKKRNIISMLFSF